MGSPGAGRLQLDGVEAVDFLWLLCALVLCTEEVCCLDFCVAAEAGATTRAAAGRAKASAAMMRVRMVVTGLLRGMRGRCGAYSRG